MSETERALFDLFRVNFGKPLTRERIASYLYAGDADGGPEFAYTVIAVSLHRLRKKIKPYGLTIEGKGGHREGRRMFWTDEAAGSK